MNYLEKAKKEAISALNCATQGHAKYYRDNSIALSLISIAEELKKQNELHSLFEQYMNEEEKDE